MSKSKIIFRIIKTVLFCALVVVILITSSEILIPKDYVDTSVYKGSLRSFSSFYSEPDNSLDVVYIGSSHVYSGISPIEIYEEYGITGYDCASSNQDAYTSYMYLKEVLKTQSPKVVVVDLMALINDLDSNESSTWSGIGSMKLSKDYVDGIVHEAGWESLPEYLVPVFRYHDRWDQLTASDFSVRFSSDYAKGQDMRYGAKVAVEFTEADFPQLQDEEDSGRVYETDQDTVDWFSKMVTLCNQENIPILFIKTPTSGYLSEFGDAMQKFADAEDVPFIDYNLMFDELELDWSADFLDSVHLNATGRTKLSMNLGEYLVDNYGLSSHQDDNWDKDCELYDHACRADELQRMTDPDEWLDTLSDSDYLIFAAGDPSCLGTDALDNLGLADANEDGEEEHLYAWTNLETDENEWSNKKAVSGTQGDDCTFYVGKDEISVNDEYFEVQSSYCLLVVYDTTLEKMVDAAYVTDEGNKIIKSDVFSDES